MDTWAVTPMILSMLGVFGLVVFFIWLGNQILKAIEDLWLD